MTQERQKLRAMIITSLFAAIIGIFAQITIPLPLVPITGQTLAIGLAATILGARQGTISVLVYILLGAVGIPVFSGFSAGFSVLVGPTGGFIIGFIPTALFIGWYLEKTSFKFTHAMVANTIGMFITLVFGTVWLKIAANLSWPAAFASGFAPFIVVGLIKAALASWIGVVVRKRLTTANILLTPKQKSA
ncbi:biotin transporter BioY [Siminovitchia sp. 179-K 8D1 HS]|uniref:biotin transporter BioY n=1 Tax=Siminovitchia sp. 179-K 8D1 HS TaxID=3142385 RepID=UPI0039A3A171